MFRRERREGEEGGKKGGRRVKGWVHVEGERDGGRERGMEGG